MTHFPVPCLIQYLAYADDIDLLSRRERELKESFIQLERESRRAGLNVNTGKTKYMVMSKNKRPQSTSMEPLQVGTYSFEQVPNFKYLGSVLTDSNETSEEIKERLKAGNKAYFSMQHLIKSRLLSRASKKRLYRNMGIENSG